jgi:AAA family ATP:ADP antiporter
VRVGIAYFLWVGIFNVMVIAQFWAFANDLYTQEQGKRLFPLIGVGSSLGAWIGSVRAKTLMEAAGPMRLLAGGAFLIILCVILARLADRHAVRDGSPKQAAAADAPVGDGQSGFGMIFSDRYLLLIALLILLLNVVNTSGEYLFGRYVVDSATAAFGTGREAEAARGQFIGEVYSSYYSHVNLLGLVLQMFVVSRVFRFLGIGRALFIHPIIAGAGYVMMLASPSFGAIRLLKTADNAIDYSLGNTTKQALWLPTSRQAKYKAKQAVDSFFMRAGDVIQAGTVYLGELAGFAVPAFAALNLALTAGWITVAAALNRRLRAKADATHTAL